MSKKTSIGGQALIEGIMMKGPYKTTMAVRKPDGSIDLSNVPEKHLREKYKFFGLPLVRGMVNLIESMISGYKALMKSADISGFTDLEDEPKVVEPADMSAEAKTEPEHETEGKLKETKKENGVLSGVIMVIGTVLGVALAVALFFVLPSLIFKGIDWLVPADLKNFRGLIEGLVKIVIFICYIALVSLEKDIKRVFMYHGAEHKTIFCYESGEELTVENVRKFKRFHPRCGTSFMFLMIVVGIVLGTVLTFALPDAITDNNLLWVPIKILLVPLTCGIGYEFIKVCGKHDNAVTRFIAAPGLWVQRLTTKEPEDSMIEIAIAAVNEVIPSDGTDEIK